MKRFTETTKWSDPWYRRLSPVAKLLWSYLTDNCDCTGLIDFDIEAAIFHIGAKIEEKHLAELASRTQRTVDGKIFIPRFIPFQYGTLSDSCPAHKPVIKLVRSRDININGKGYQYPNARVALGLPNSTGKGKDKDKEKEEGSTEGRLHPSLVPTPEDIYNAYPRKVGRPDALAAIVKAVKRHGSANVLERTMAYAKVRNGDLTFVPNPSTWFNQDRFNDDPETWKPRHNNGSAEKPKQRFKDVTTYPE